VGPVVKDGASGTTLINKPFEDDDFLLERISLSNYHNCRRNVVVFEGYQRGLEEAKYVKTQGIILVVLWDGGFSSSSIFEDFLILAFFVPTFPFLVYFATRAQTKHNHKRNKKKKSCFCS
jgi:hypothetical protein